MFALGCAVALSPRLLIDTAVHFGLKQIDSISWIWMLWYVAAYSLLAVAVVLLVRGLQRSYAQTIPARAWRLPACATPLLLTLGLVKTVGVAAPEVLYMASGAQLTTDSSEHRGITTALYRGLLWVRDHTRPCDTLAVNNHSTSARETDSKYFYYSAFTERSVYLESWAYTALGAYGGQPYSGRLALNQRAVVRGEPQALRRLAELGVTYVLIDKLHGTGAAEPAAVSTLVFSNSALDVYRLSPPDASVAARCAGPAV